MESEQILTEVFGSEIGRKLFGAAVKLSAVHNVDLDDVIQDMIIEALEIKERYGFVHINTVVLRTKNALYAGKSGFRYGNNKYHTDKGQSEVCLADLSLDGNRRTQVTDDREDEDTSYSAEERLFEFVSEQVEWDLREQFYETLSSLDNETQIVAYGLMAGFSQVEIAESLGKSSAYVTGKKQSLQGALEWAVA